MLVAELPHAVREPGMEHRLVVGAVGDDVAELHGLVPLLLPVPGGVDHECVGVQVRIGHAVDRPRRGVQELRPGDVAGGAVVVATIDADAGFYVAFDLAHGVADGIAERVANAGVVGERREDRDALRRVEREVRSRAAVLARACGETLSRQRVLVAHQGRERVPLNCPDQSQPRSTKAMPDAGGLGGIVVSPRQRAVEVGDGGSRIITVRNA